MCLRAASLLLCQSVTLSGRKIISGCVSAKRSNLRGVLRRSNHKIEINVRMFTWNNKVSNKMLPTLEEHVFQTNQQQLRFKSTLANTTTINGHRNGQQKSENQIQSEYEEAIKTLNTLQTNADTLRRTIGDSNKLKALANMPKYLDRIGITLEELDKQSFIHVSGTKGKGSTCAITESILREYGVKTGFFSSPHLMSVTERIRINGVEIEKKKFTQAFWFVYKRLEGKKQDVSDIPPYFQFLTILALHVFLAEKLDVIIFEVGIGGELDCTNVLRNTRTVGITSLGLEHTQILGETLEEIAWQKAGIIKPGSHVFATVTQPECLEVIKERAVEKKATLHIVPDFSQYFQHTKHKSILRDLNTIVQLNGSLAIQLAYDWLRQHQNGFKRDFIINETKLTEPVIKGLINCNWPGRCQRINFLNFNIHLDGAHTIESMNICSDWFAKVTKESTSPKVLLFNTTGDRDSKKLLDVIRRYSQFDLVCFVPNIVGGNGNTRDDIQSSTSIAEQLKRAKMHEVNWSLLCTEENTENKSHVFESILECLNFIRNLYGSERKLDILVTGSLHLLGATILSLNRLKEESDEDRS